MEEDLGKKKKTKEIMSFCVWKKKNFDLVSFFFFQRPFFYWYLVLFWKNKI